MKCLKFGKLPQNCQVLGDEVRRQFEFPAAQYNDFKTNSPVSQKIFETSVQFSK